MAATVDWLVVLVMASLIYSVGHWIGYASGRYGRGKAQTRQKEQR